MARTIESTISRETVRNDRSGVYGELVVTMFLWGLAWPIGRLLAGGLPPVSIAAIRYAIVVPALFLVVYLREGRISIPRKWLFDLAILGFFSVTIYQLAFLYGVKYAAAGDDSLVIGVGPLVVAVLAPFVIGEKLTTRKLLGFLSGLAGVVVISTLSPNVDVPNRYLGIGLVFAGATSYAIYTVYLRKFHLLKNSTQSQSTNNRGASSTMIVAWSSLLGWLFLIPPSLAEAPWTYTWGASSWLGILYLAILSTVVGYLAYADGVAKIGAGRAAVFVNLVPVFGIASSVVLLGEKVSVIPHGVGFALILLGVILVNRKSSPATVR